MTAILSRAKWPAPFNSRSRQYDRARALRSRISSCKETGVGSSALFGRTIVFWIRYTAYTYALVKENAGRAQDESKIKVAQFQTGVSAEEWGEKGPPERSK